MIKNLIKVAAELDAAGFTKEADQVDAIIKKIAGKATWSKHIANSGDKFSYRVMDHEKHHGGASYDETLKYNKQKNPSFDPKKYKDGYEFWLLCDNTCGG